jgi:hypothetical protein
MCAGKIHWPATCLVFQEKKCSENTLAYNCERSFYFDLWNNYLVEKILGHETCQVVKNCWHFRDHPCYHHQGLMWHKIQTVLSVYQPADRDRSWAQANGVLVGGVISLSWTCLQRTHLRRPSRNNPRARRHCWDQLWSLPDLNRKSDHAPHCSLTTTMRPPTCPWKPRSLWLITTWLSFPILPTHWT